MKRGSLIYLSFPFDIVFLTDLSFASSSKDWLYSSYRVVACNYNPILLYIIFPIPHFVYESWTHI
jgi:hypothetical protein